MKEGDTALCLPSPFPGFLALLLASGFKCLSESIIFYQASLPLVGVTSEIRAQSNVRAGSYLPAPFRHIPLPLSIGSLPSRKEGVCLSSAGQSAGPVYSEGSSIPKP